MSSLPMERTVGYREGWPPWNARGVEAKVHPKQKLGRETVQAQVQAPHHDNAGCDYNELQ